MPPVSWPWNGGTRSACAGAHASIPHTATRLAAPIIRIADSISLGGTLKRIARHEKNGRGLGADLLERCCRLALDLVRASRHRQPVGSSGGLPMRDLSTCLKRLGPGAGLGVLSGLFSFGQPAQAAYPCELNFWLSGPLSDGRVAECGRALSTITSQFQEKESQFWNSSLQITAN